MSAITGIVLLTRHGDRKGFYQNPKTYSAVSTNLTVLGFLQEYQNGLDLRNYYLTNETGGIQGINSTQAETKQLNVMADAGGEGGVIIESANSLLQGLYPPYNNSITLANGSTVSWGLTRAQPIPIETIEPDQSVWMEGWTDCNAWTDYLNQWYQSADFKKQAAVADGFYQSISGVLGNRPLTLENGYNIFDYMNVESIHNATISPQLLPSLSQARYWADYHESGAFGKAGDPSHIANIAGQSMLPPLLDGLHQAANASSGVKLTYLAASYKPFMGLFNMMQLPAPLSTSLVDYASAAIFEVRADQSVTMRFRNGTQGDFVAYPLFGTSSESMPLSDFSAKLQPYSLDTLAKWCDKCANSQTRGCATLASLNGTGGGHQTYAPDTSTTGRHRVSPVVAGVIGALVTLAIAALLLGAWLFFGGLTERQRRLRRRDEDLAQQQRKLTAPDSASVGAASSGFELPARSRSLARSSFQGADPATPDVEVPPKLHD